jgi:hypothetical protein
MTSIDRLSTAPIATGPLAGAASSGAPLNAADMARQTIGEVGNRVFAWVGASRPGGDAGAAEWGRSVGTSDFRPDAGELERRGDIYGLRDLAAGISGDMGGTPTQEGELRRALEDFTRASVIQVAGLAGGDAGRQVQGLQQALDVAADPRTGDLGGLDGVIGRLEAATRELSTQNA